MTTIQKMLYAGAASMALFAAATPAAAATTINPKTVFNTYNSDTQTGSYGFTVSGSGMFSQAFSFDVGTLPGDLGVTISSISVRAQSMLDSLSVMLNNKTYALTRTDGANGSSSYGYEFLQPVEMGGQNLVITGSKTGTAATSISGTLNFTPSAVPEPATWALMIGGFGLVGGTLRRRQSQVRTAVRFA